MSLHGSAPAAQQFDVIWNVMKILSLGWGGWLAEQADVEAVYYLGSTLLTLAGVIGILALRDVSPESLTEQMNS